MVNYTFSGLTPHPIFNELDSQGLFLGLSRISEERNQSYKARLLDVFVNRASSTYQGLIYGITRELGLAISEVMTVYNTLDGNGDPVLPFPATVFEETKCTLYSDYGEGTILKTIDRFETSGVSWTLAELVNEINSTGYFTAVLDSNAIPNQRAMTIFNQSSVKFSLNELISGKGHRVKLAHENIVINSVTVVSDNVTRRVDTEGDLTYSGDYYVDRAGGFLITNVIPAPNSRIRYQYRKDIEIFKASPVILHNIMSDDFKTKMFEQGVDEDGNTVNGSPTILGADIVNELLSVFPSNWGK